MNLTEEQFRDVAFAVYCQHCALEESHEADEPEVIAVMERLNEVMAMCNDLKKSRQS